MLNNENKMLAASLANADKKIEFKEDSILKDFIINNKFVYEPNNTSLSFDVVTEVIYNELKDNLECYRSIKEHLSTYIYKMRAYVKEQIDSNSDVILKQVKVPSCLRDLRRLHEGDNGEFTNTKAIALINLEMEQDDILSLVNTDIMPISELEEPLSINDIRYLLTAYLKTLPTTTNLTSILKAVNGLSLNSMLNSIYLYNAVYNLIHNPKDAYFPTELKGFEYEKEVVPVLKMLLAKMEVTMSHRKDAIEMSHSLDKPVSYIRPDLERSHASNSKYIEVYADVYKKYLEQYGSVEGAVEAIMALALVENTNIPPTELTITNIGSKIEELFNSYKTYVENTSATKRNRQLVRLSEEFVREYINTIGEILENSTIIAERYEAIIENGESDKIPLTENILNLAYSVLSEGDVEDPSLVDDVCFKIFIEVFRSIDIEIEAFLDGLLIDEINGKKLEDENKTLAALMSVLANMMSKQVEVVDA